MENPTLALTALLAAGRSERCRVAREEAEAFARDFGARHTIGFEFEPAALDRIVALCLERDQNAPSLCEGIFKDYQFGLGLIRKNSGQETFRIPAEAIDAPDRVLSQWVVASYRNAETPEGQA